MSDQEKEQTVNLNWRVHTPNLLSEICNLNADGIGMLSKPLQIFSIILAQVGQRASELNDPQLNALMCRLTIYDIADPTSEDHDAELVREIIEHAEKLNEAEK